MGYSRRIAGDIFTNAEDFVYSSPTNVSKGFGGHWLQVQTQKQITETLRGRFKLLVSSDAFSQSGKGVCGKKASFFTTRLETIITSLNRFNIIRLPSKQVCLYSSFFFGNGFDQIPIIFWPQITHPHGCY